MCTRRVCEDILSLLSTLVDFGLLAHKKKARTVAEDKDKEKRDADEDGCDGEAEEDDGILSVHNTFMDVIIRSASPCEKNFNLFQFLSRFACPRLLKLFGCTHNGCASHTPLGESSSLGPPPPSSTAPAPTDLLRAQAVSLLSRLMWYDKNQFKKFITLLVQTREIPFLLGFLHSYLGFCTDPSNPHSPLPSGGTNTSGQGERQKRTEKCLLRPVVK